MTPYMIKMSKVLTPRSAVTSALVYDERRQVTVVAADPLGSPAVCRSDVPALVTKKADMEKGEDVKDKWR